MPESATRPRSPTKKQPPKRQAPRRRRRRRQNPTRLFRVLIPILALVVILGVVVNLVSHHLPGDHVPRWVDKQIVEVNGSGRRGEKLDGVNSIVVHYVGNPGTTAQQNHDFYDQPDTTVSSHFLIGLEGEIIQCVPLDEKSSASNNRNNDTISIETCHPDESGAYNEATYESLVKLTAALCTQLKLDENDLMRHYDINGKVCPKYFVDDEAAWKQFKKDVKTAIKDKSWVE